MDLASAPVVQDAFEEKWIAQLTAGDLAKRFWRFPLGGAMLQVQEFQQGIQLRSKVPPLVAAIGCVIESHAPIVVGGMVWSAENALVVSGSEVDIISRQPCTFGWVELPLSSASEPINVIEPNKANGFSQACVRTAFALRNTITGHATTDGAEALVRAAEQVRASRKAFESASSRGSYELARRLEEFMWSRVGEPILLKTLSDFCGRSVRTVIYSFQSSYGLGPLSYFKIRRMNAVRDRLINGNRDPMIVDLAAEFGFWHLGHFGHDYRTFFGETPSQTRLRAKAQEIQ